MSDDFKSAKEYLFREENKEFNIALPYNGTRKIAGTEYILSHLKVVATDYYL